MLAVAEAMSASMHWNFLAQYSILKEMLADLRSIATTWDNQTAGSATEPTMKKEMEEQEEQAESKGDEKEEVDIVQSGESATVPLQEKEVKDVGSKDEEDEERPAWIRSLEEFVAGLWWWKEEEAEETNAGSTVETEVPTLQRSAGAGAGAPAHQEMQPGDVEEQLEQFEKQLEQLEEQLEEHMHDAAAHEEEVKETDGGQAVPAAVQEGQEVGNQCYHLTPDFNPHHLKEEMETEQVDHRVVQQLHHAFRLLQISPCFGGAWLQFSNCLCRLGGHGAAAMALWWLEEGSTTGFHFDQAALNFQVASLASLLLHLFTWSCRSFPLR